MVQLQDIAPAEIEAESFRIIESEFTEQTGKKISDYREGEFRVLQRVIHATGDFSIAESIVFQHDPVDAAVDAFRRGGDIVTDVNMVASGISRNILSKFGGTVSCRVSDEETADLARKQGITRSDAAMRLSCTDNLAAIAVGNAPTALIAALRLIDEQKMQPGLIVGVPVGFVNAAESKEMLKQYKIPAITITGRRGGSPIAAAIINALLRLADQ
ncbi:precorrin-8X methylmutase [Desulfopila aestuarii]|uniref:Precorrin-8X methylmutase n=1 Tax=Desulfopila aestuarii DSM 18488 TaxID=1121416 RepID=A0A1M7YBV4_9BACT|nr:precorrin-8X methylmutase [Desulfopila aestuarii]SHO50117.1 precorrin-8X methylmutase [Desulfopila aestuarii DSM 18488]